MAHENDWVADKIQGTSTTWSQKEWSGITSFSGYYIWTDGTDTYYSYNAKQYVLDKTNSAWNTKTWSGLTSFSGDKVWTDGTDIYYSLNTTQYVLDKMSSTWNKKTWSGLTNFNGGRVWTDGTDIYYSSGSSQYVLDKTTSTWRTKTWSGLTSFYGSGVWTDGENVYYSNGENNQYILDKTNSTWSKKTWSGFTSAYASAIWTDGKNIYYSSDYVLDKENSAWRNAKYWSGLTSFVGEYIWTDGTDIYYSEGSDHYILKKPTSVPYRLNFPELKESIDLHDKWVSDVIEDKPDVWIEQNWGGFSPFWGQGIWTDGENIYYLSGIYSYILNKAEKTWEPKTWYGLESISGPEQSATRIWSDGENIYYSDSRKQFVLDLETSTWNAKTWNGRSDFYGSNVWTDGENVYLSGGNANYQYVLDKATSTWSAKTWNGYQNIIASSVWFDGDIIYYSQGSNQYVLDKATSTWSAKTWNGFVPAQGAHIWSRNGNLYYSDNYNQYVLDRETSTWYAKTWSGLVQISSSGLWSDGDETYYSYNSGTNQYKLTDIKITSVPYRYDFPEMIESKDIDNAWITHDVPDEYINAVPYRPAFPALVESVDISDKWLISDDIPFRWNFPELIRSTANPVDPPSFFTFKGRSSAEFGSIEILPLCLKHEEKTDFINFITGTPYVLETSILRSKVITITINLKDISPANIDRVNSWLIGTGKLVLSRDPGRYYIATCNNALTGQKMISLGKVVVQFNVMPYKYDAKESDSFEAVSLVDETLHKTAAIYYKGSAPAESTFKITATGNIEIYNVQTEKTVEIKGLTEYCIIDIKARKVTDENDLNILDRTYGDIFDLMLAPGDNYFFINGSVTAIGVKKKTRWY